MLLKVFVAESRNAEVFNKVAMWVIFHEGNETLALFYSCNNFKRIHGNIHRCSHLNKDSQYSNI